MFKSVEYVSFEHQQELRRLAERATPVLAGVIRSWRDEITVVWRPAPHGTAADLELTLTLTLPTADASASGCIRRRDFEPGEEEYLRMNLREVWLDTLDKLIAQVAANVQDSLADPVEA